MWNKGSIKIENQTFTYSAKVYGEPSEDYGIEDGKISKLEIRLGDTPVARYDRGWDIEPETENAQLALLAILKRANSGRRATRLFLSFTYTALHIYHMGRDRFGGLFLMHEYGQKGGVPYGDQRKKANSDSNQGVGGKSREKKTE